MGDHGYQNNPPAPAPAPAPPPLPPSPPPRQVSAPVKESPSHFLEKLASAPPGYLDDIPTVAEEPTPYEPVHYFFYGTLCDPATLARILDRAETPRLRPAQIVGYELSSWGQYRTLVDGPSGHVVQGLASLIRSPDEEYKLAYYETNAYRLAPCLIKFMDGEDPAEVGGMTFMYAGDSEALKQGKFDRNLWETQMNVRLPSKWGRDGGASFGESSS